MSIKVLTLFGEEIIEEPVAKEEKKRTAKTKKPEEPSVVESDTDEQDGEVSIAASDATVVKKKQVKPGKNLQVSSSGPKILEGWKAEKQYYGIGDVARLFGVNVSHIRFWTNEFELKVRTNKKGDRMYNPAQIDQLRMIYHLVKEKGFTIAGAKIKLKERKRSPEHNAMVRDKLLSLKDKLMALKNSL